MLKKAIPAEQAYKKLIENKNSVLSRLIFRSKLQGSLLDPTYYKKKVFAKGKQIS